MRMLAMNATDSRSGGFLARPDVQAYGCNADRNAVARQCAASVDSTMREASPPPTILSASAIEGLPQGRGVPDAAGDEVMKLMIATVRRVPPSLDALAITSANQPRNINSGTIRARTLCRKALRKGESHRSRSASSRSSIVGPS